MPGTDRVNRFSIDDEGFFDMGTDHNLLLWYAERGVGMSMTSKAGVA